MTRRAPVQAGSIPERSPLCGHPRLSRTIPLVTARRGLAAVVSFADDHVIADAMGDPARLTFTLPPSLAG